MSLELIANFYDTSSKDIRNWLIGKCSRSSITHCGLEIHYNDKSVEISTSCFGGHHIAIVDPYKYHRVCYQPKYTVELGIVDKPIPSMPDTYHLSGTKYIAYHFFGRYLGFPVPNSCASFVSAILVDMGLLKEKIFYPELLYKELKQNANDINSRTSRRG